MRSRSSCLTFAILIAGTAVSWAQTIPPPTGLPPGRCRVIEGVGVNADCAIGQCNVLSGLGHCACSTLADCPPDLGAGDWSCMNGSAAGPPHNSNSFCDPSNAAQCGSFSQTTAGDDRCRRCTSSSECGAGACIAEICLCPSDNSFGPECASAAVPTMGVWGSVTSAVFLVVIGCVIAWRRRTPL